MNFSGKNNGLKPLLGAMLMLALFCSFAGAAVYAAGDAIVCSKTGNSGIYLYIRGGGEITGAEVQIGNVKCNDISVAPISDMGMSVQTVLLLDNSLSLSQKFGAQAKEIMKHIVSGHMDGEQFKIATFSSELEDLTDFSDDYDAVNSLIDDISYENQDTYLTDILYAFLEEQNKSEKVNYMRIIVITDGADDNEITYTQAELIELMKKSNIPIHTIGVQLSKNSKLLEQLFAYSRATKGFYFLADRNSDLNEIYTLLQQDYSLECMKLVPDNSLLDGSMKEVKLTLRTAEGETVLTTSVRMPFGEMSAADEDGKEASTEEPEDVPGVEETETVPNAGGGTKLPSIGGSRDTAEPGNPEKKNFPWMAVIIAASVLAAGAVAAIIVLNVRKKKKGVTVNKVITADTQEPKEDVQEEKSNATRMLIRPQTEERKTSMLWDRAPSGARQSYVILSDMSHANREFKAAINTSIKIGRRNTDILIDYDDSVSGQHCEIVKKGNLYYINDLKSSNGTYYGGTRVYSETAIMDGGVLGIGEQKFRIHFREE